MRVYILNTNQTPIADFEAIQSVDYSTNLRFSSVYPRGYDSCSFRVRRADIFAGYGVKENYAVLVRDGALLVWDGKIVSMSRVIAGGDEYIDIDASGWYSDLNERRLQKRWHDVGGIANLVDAGNGAQSAPDMFPHITRRRDSLQINYAISTADVLYDSAYHLELYSMPGGHYIKRVTCDYEGRSGEIVNVITYNIATSTADETDNVSGSTGYTGALNTTISGNTASIYIKLETTDNQFDYNDWIKFSNLQIYARYNSAHSAYGSEAYTLSELVEDALLISQDAGANISADFSQLESITVDVDGFCIEEPTPVSEVIDKLAAYGTASNETIAFSVWGRNGTSDNLPRCVLETYPATTDYEYVLDINDVTLRSFQNSKDTGQIYNYIWLNYTAQDGRGIWLTPDDYSGLTDAASIAQYGRRDYVLRVGKADSDATALNIGYRFLAYHAEARYRGTFGVIGWIRNKAGGITPAGWIRAGQRVYVPALDTVFVLRQVSYDAENDTAILAPDLPPDNVNLAIANLRRQMENPAPKYEGAG